LRATRRLNAQGAVRFRHWRLYGERGLAGARAAVWVWDETLTIEYEAEILAHNRVAFEAGGRGLRDVDEPRLYATGHASPQPFLSSLDETAWHPARRLAPYCPRRKRVGAGRQERLFDEEREASVG
jgi:hypothetical protein